MRAPGNLEGSAGRRDLFVAALILPLALYGFLAARRISAGVGYQMDEALYVESAVYVLADGRGAMPFAHEDASFIGIGGRRWPLMIFPYVGALKAYVALPLFAAFGASAETARAAGVILGALGIAGLVVLVEAFAGPVAALSAGAALAIHPSYLDLTVFDHGGTSVWMGGMGLVALALAFRRRRPSAFLLGLAAGLGIWARANFFWLVVAGLGAGVIAFGRRLRVTATEVAAAVAGGLCGAAPLVLYELASRGGTLRAAAAVTRPLTESRIVGRLSQMAELMFSSRQLRAIWGGPGTLGWEVAGGATLLLLVVAAAWIPIVAKEAGSRLRRALALTAVFLAVLMTFSGLPVGQHHMAAVLPPAIGSLAILAGELARSDSRLKAVMAAGGLTLAAIWLTWDVRIDRGLRRTGGLGVWSSALGDLGHELAARRIPPGRLKILDWGFQNNLYVVSGGSVYGTEIFWGATGDASSRGLPWNAEIRDGGTFLFLAGGQESPAARGFREALAHVVVPRRETVFRDRTGAPVARLVEVERGP